MLKNQDLFLRQRMPKRHEELPVDLYIEQKIIRTGKIEDLSEEELNKRISTIVDDNRSTTRSKI